MISAFEVYLIFQLDSIKDAVTGVGVAALCAAVGATVYGLIGASDEEPWAPRLLRWAKVSAVVAALSLLVSAATPSSRAAAAIVILPAIANNETIQREAAEVYDLAKDALRKLATSSEEKPEAK